MNDAPLRITSLQNEQVKALVRLRNRRERDQAGVMLIEEPLVIARALAAGHPMSAVYHCPENLKASDRELLAQLRRAAPKTIELSPPVMAKVSYRDQPEGLLVVAPQVHRNLRDLAPRDPALLVVLESVEKPGNLGAVLRVADAAGADAVIVCGEGTDLFNPNVLRASRGAFFSVPTIVATRDELPAYLAGRGITAVATSPTEGTDWDRTPLAGPVALILGAEHDGLSAGLLDEATVRVSIPMLGRGDSLNVATSAAVLLYEALRQRRASP